MQGINFDDIMIRLHKTTGTLCDWQPNALKAIEEKDVQFKRLISLSVCQKHHLQGYVWNPSSQAQNGARTMKLIAI
jgi:hypothetical protein